LGAEEFAPFYFKNIMITSLIKQATINLAPKVEETKDWFSIDDSLTYEDEDDEYEDDEDDEDEDDEDEECDCEDAEIIEVSLTTNVEELLFDSLFSLEDFLFFSPCTYLVRPFEYAQDFLCQFFFVG
jgi:hypothetical protein